MKIRRILLSILISFIMFSNISNASKQYLLGDINKDGAVDSRDQLIIMRHIMASTRKIHPEWILTGDELKLADVTQNGVVNNSDMLAILRYIAANRNTEKIGNKHKEWLEIGKLDLETPIEPTPEPDKQIDVTEIKLDKTKIELDTSTAKTKILKAIVEPENATNKEIKWTTSNEKIVTVDSKGKITAKKNGTAKITATSQSNKEKIAICEVTIKTSATGIKLNEKSSTIVEGKTNTLKATITPSTATDKKVTWTSSNKKIATVNSKGKITAKKIGTATITATINGEKATCKITVTGGYWEIKNGKYIYHYLDGNKRTWSKSEYIGWKKLKEQNVKALDPKAYKRIGNGIKYAGIYHDTYYVKDNTANNIAIKNGSSPYAITVDHDNTCETIFKMNKGFWEPYKSTKVLVGKNGLSYNQFGYTDKKTYTKNTHTPIGLFYINGNRSFKGNESINLYWVEFGVEYTNGKGGHGWNKGDYLHAGYNPISFGGHSDGCIVSDTDWAKWIFYNCGRGTPVLIW